ncbi:MAG: YceI family protein [Ferruginibacter sp.]
MTKIFGLVLTVFFATASVAQVNLTPMDAGSKVHFVIKNFGINTGGDITGLKGSIKYDKSKPTLSSANVTVNVKTIDTDNSRRDKHLLSDDYFDAAKFPEIHIVSTKIETTTSAGNLLFTGMLTIKDVTKNIQFPFIVTPKDGGYLFEGNFTIDRRVYGVGGNSATMSDNVEVKLSVFAK